MSKDSIDDFLKNLGMKKEQKQQPETTQWDRIIQRDSSYLILGDVGTGKSALAYWLLETFSRKYSLLPVVAGFPLDKKHLLPPGFVTPTDSSECTKLQDAIVLIDEADLQLPIEDVKAREYVVNFLSLPGHRHDIFLLAFHFPRLVLGRYLPFFSGFLLKRPPYLIEFASKGRNDTLGQMMLRAEERFAELPCEGEVNRHAVDEVKKHTYVVAPRIRWQGMIENGLCSFWSKELSEVWAGVGVDKGENNTKATQQGDLFEPAETGYNETMNSRYSVEESEYAIKLFGESTNETRDLFDRYAGYSEKKLTELLAQRGLATVGKHLILVARLAVNDAKYKPGFYEV